MNVNASRGSKRLRRIPICPILVLILLGSVGNQSCFSQWKMHVIDNTSRGADGVRLADFNQDGLLDIVTGWEEGGVIRVYQNPGPRSVRDPWPRVTVGKVKSPEDAVFADLDGDGSLDVVSCCEGKTKTVFVHWAPKEKGKYMVDGAWETAPIPATEKVAAWMFSLAADFDGKNGIDLLVGSKGNNASVGWLESPKNPRNLKGWKFHRIEDAGWIMSLRKVEVMKRMHFLVSDRKGPHRGVYFLSNDFGKGFDNVRWKRTDVMKGSWEYMFLDYSKASQINDANRNSESQGGVVTVATRNKKSIRFLMNKRLEVAERFEIANPQDIPNGKAIVSGDIDLDGKVDLVFSANTQAFKNKKTVGGLHWLSGRSGFRDTQPIASPKGKKYDRIELIDLDGDGDLDALTCEEAANLGVIWFENPAR